MTPEASPGINMKQNDTKCYILHNILGSMRGGCVNVIEHYVDKMPEIGITNKSDDVNMLLA